MIDRLLLLPWRGGLRERHRADGYYEEEQSSLHTSN